MFDNWVADLRYSFRRLRHRTTYTALTVLTLALGVAGAAAVYAIARPLLLKPLPVRAEGEVNVFWIPFDWSEAEFLYLRPELREFSGVAAYRPQDVTLQADGSPARLVEAVSATSELFRVLGVSPASGPGFREGDDRPGAEPTVVLSHSLWRELGGDPGIVGRRVELGGVARTVTGVMPASFWFPSPSVRAWLSEDMDPENQAGNYAVVARTRPGATPAALSAQVRRITTLLDERFDYPVDWDKTKNATLTPLREFLVGPVRPAVVAMLAAMAVILLVACVNVAALMLGQVDSRGTELAVRSALGAGRQSIVRQLVIESLVIGALAGVAGAVLASLGFRVLVGALPLGELAEATRLDWTLFAAAILIALVVATAVALVPGASVARGDLQTRLTRARTGGVAGRGGRLEGGLVVAQVALVLLMAAGAGLLIRSVGKLRAIDPGLNTHGVAVVDVVIPATTEAERRPQLLQGLVEAVRGLPGVASAAAVQQLPMRGPGDSWGIRIEGQPEDEDNTTLFRMASPDYFRTMGIPVRSGRGFLESDRAAGDQGVVVINQALADRFFAGVDPLGRRIALGDRWHSVVGVVGNVAEASLRDPPAPARYMLYEHAAGIRQEHSIVMRVREGGDPAAVLGAAQRAIQAAAPGVAVRQATTLDNVFTRAIGPALQVMSLLALLAALALALGSIGVYGVVSHFVARRRRDWGIRIALGLKPAYVVRQVVGRGGALVAAGIVLGLAGFMLLARVLTSFLYGVGTADPVSLAVATAVLAAAGLVAAWLPARRASRINPAEVLREQ